MQLKYGGLQMLLTLNRLLVLQKRTVRMITLSDKMNNDYSFAPCNPLFFKLEILKVQDIFKLRLAKFIFNCLNKRNPINFHSWFTLTSQIHKYNTRSKYVNIDRNIVTRTLFVPTARTTYYGLKVTKVLGPKLWNDLPPSLRVEKIVFSTFNKGIKKYIMEMYSI